MKIKNLLVVLFLVISSFTFAQENPSPVEDGIIVRCPIGVKNVWNSVYIGSSAIRKNISLSIDSTVYGKTTKIAFKNSSGFPDTATGYYTLGSGIRQWKNRSSDYLYYKSDTTGAFWVNVEYTNGPSLEYGGLDRNEVINLIQTTSSDTTTYVPKYGDFTVENTKTFNDSTVFKEQIVISGSATNRPFLSTTYGDVGTPIYVDFGQLGVGEMNATINFDYSQGLHWYRDTSRAMSLITNNIGSDSIFCWQWIPKGYGNQPSQPDAWALSGNTTPWRVNSQGFMGVIGGITSIFKRQGNPTVGTSTASDYTDTTKYNFYGRGGKSAVDWKLGIGTFTPVGVLHIFNKATPKQTVTYNALTDVTIEDAGVSDRAQLSFVSPNGSLIAMGDSATYNKAYLQYVNSTGILNIISNTSVNINGTTVTPSGTTTSTNTVIAPSFTSNAGGGFQATAGGIFYFTGRSVIKSPADGTVTFTNNAESTGARLIFGTATLNNLPVYADNAAALSGGLTAGQIYRTSTGVLMVTY